MQTEEATVVLKTSDDRFAVSTSELFTVKEREDIGEATLRFNANRTDLSLRFTMKQNCSFS